MMKKIQQSGNIAFFILLALLLVTFIPFLGEAWFNSKGEPREAIVAVSMLQQHNWILPLSNGDVMPYKPPCLAWFIALFSMVTGHVTEFTSRLPSALALIGMTLWMFLFFARRTSRLTAFLGSVITFTAFEVYRAGFACRVDMLLTFFIVGALLSLYTYWERELRGIPWLAVLMMSGAALTKGPVGIILPCLVMWIFMLAERVKLWEATWKLALCAVAALIIPSLWYIAAYQQGGSEFIRLAMEENFGRMTGTMSYESHVNPFWYNFITVFAGYTPIIILCLLSLPFLFIKKLWSPDSVRTWWQQFKTLDAPRKFALITIVVIFVFYCIPKSKRSVYLLPIYPFIALFLAEYILFIAHRAQKAIKIYAWVLGVAAIAIFATFIVIRCGAFPTSIFHGRHAGENIRMIASLDKALPAIKWFLIEIPVIAAVALFLLRKRLSPTANVMGVMALTVTLYWAFAGVYQPAVLNAKSDRPVAELLNRLQPEGDIYAHVSADMLKFFTIDFYTDDRIKPIESTEATSGYFIIGVEDARTFLPENADKYHFFLKKHFNRRSCDTKQDILLLRFVKK